MGTNAAYSETEYVPLKHGTNLLNYVHGVISYMIIILKFKILLLLDDNPQTKSLRNFVIREAISELNMGHYHSTSNVTIYPLLTNILK
jgi:hypothetical protein